jgi:integrase
MVFDIAYCAAAPASDGNQMIKLTERQLAKLAKPGSKPFEIVTGPVPGLRLCVRPSGAMSWCLRYRASGKSRKMVFARYPGLPLAEARKVATVLYGQVAAGRDPGAERKVARKREKEGQAPIRDGFDKVARQYLKYAARRTRASTAAETERILRVYVAPAWKGKRLSEIDKAAVRALIDGIAARAPVMANRVLTAVKALFNFAVAEDILTVSPCAGLKPPAAETSRDRVLADDELGAVWRACEGLDTGLDWQGAAVRRPHGDVIRMLALTGQRLNEVAQMSWAELDLDAKTWNLPRERCKNGHAHVVPLSDQALAILAAQLPRESDRVFGVSGFSRAKKALDAAAKLGAPWTLHDLRRTAASGMARLGVDIATIEKVLNHQSGLFRGIVSVYQRHNYLTQKRQALALWAEHVTRCAGNIVIARPAETVTMAEAA